MKKSTENKLLVLLNEKSINNILEFIENNFYEKWNWLNQILVKEWWQYQKILFKFLENPIEFLKVADFQTTWLFWRKFIWYEAGARLSELKSLWYLETKDIIRKWLRPIKTYRLKPIIIPTVRRASKNWLILRKWR